MQNTADLMEALTGFSYNPDEIVRVGERVNNLARAFNVREGFKRQHDILPKRLMEEPLAEGASKGAVINTKDLNTMLDEYYTVRNWNLETGTPTKEKLSELGLGYAAGQLEL